MKHTSVHAAGFVAFAAMLLSCAETEVDWLQYNAESDSLEVQVGAVEVQEDGSVALYSSTGLVEIGIGTISPGGGPIGTEHSILVTVSDDYANDVDRVSIRTDSEARDEDEYDLESDSAGEGLYATTLVSVGDDGEVRTDTLTFRLWYDANQDTGG
jgi:hypothetical protein